MKRRYREERKSDKVVVALQRYIGQIMKGIR